MILREYRFPEQYRCEDTKFVFNATRQSESRNNQLPLEEAAEQF